MNLSRKTGLPATIGPNIQLLFRGRFQAAFPALQPAVMLVLIAAVALTACIPFRSTTEPLPTRASPLQIAEPASPAGETAQATPPQDQTPTAVPQIEGIYDFPENVNPLTGLPVEDPSRLERRPVMVKVSNFPRTGRPHAGLSFADMVFEYYIGYGLNRFLAIYYSQDSSQVGPVRSGRLVDAQLGEMYQGLLFYANADPQVDEKLLAELGPRALAERDIPSPPKYRIGEVLDETTLFVNTAELTDYVNSRQEVSNTRRDLRGMIFSDIIHPVNEPAVNLGVQFWTTTRGEWKYDPQTGKYLRWIEEIEGENDIKMIPLVDRLTNEQLAFSNVIILFTTYIEYAPTLHDILLYNNPDGKRAIFFRDGVMTEGTWKTTDNGRPIQFFNSWGLPMHLKPGNTWIVLTGDSSLFSQVEPGTWELRFDLP
ncbi:MAG: DUF3048 domain-containing protein [Chloroflexi bacterium]|nr:DUF3048 domain-containing protein [Chloroflexota bacterium]